jgi:choline oxidase
MIGERCADLIRAGRSGETTTAEADFSLSLA